jgi:ethanolamine transporter EutH
MKFKTIAMTGVMSLAGLGLIGAGAHAAFTTSTSTVQPLYTGAPVVVTWAAGSSCPIVGDNCTTLTLATGGYLGSTFDLPSTIYIQNTGNIPVTLTSLEATDTNYSGLGQYVGMCTYGLGMNWGGPLSAFPGDGTPLPFTGGAILAAGASANYQVEIYAGMASTVPCSDGPGGVVAALNTPQQGQTDNVTLTVGYTG